MFTRLKDKDLCKNGLSSDIFDPCVNCYFLKCSLDIISEKSRVRGIADGIIIDMIWNFDGYIIFPISGTIDEYHVNTDSVRQTLLEELLERQGNRSSNLMSALLELSFEGASVSLDTRHIYYFIYFFFFFSRSLRLMCSASGDRNSVF